MKKKTNSYLTKKDIGNLESLESVLIDSDETLSQRLGRFTELVNEDGPVPGQVALQALCDDNPKLNADAFTAWYTKLIDDEEFA